MMGGEEARGAFLEWLERERRAAALTVEAYGADIAGFLGFLTQHLGGEPDLAALGALRQADVRAWLAADAADGIGNATRARRLSAVRTFFRFLARRLGVENPALALIATPRAKRPVPRALGLDQASDVTERIGEMSDAAAIQARDTALFVLLYGCGLRIAEALALNVRDAPLPGSDAHAARGRQGQQGADRAGAAGGARGYRRVAGAASGSGSRTARCSSGLAAGGWIRPWRSGRCGCSGGCTGCRSMRRRMRCGIRSRRICWRAGLICARSRICWGTPACRPRSAIRRWMRRG